MKKINLSKEFLLNGMLIGVLSIGLVSCGGGGGGGSGSSTPISSGSSSSSTLFSGSSSSSTSLSFSTYLYSGTNYINEPIITVYINDQPVQLLADTGASGLIVNSSAVNISQSDLNSSYTFSVTFGDGSSETGIMASATVCINPSNTASCIVMPIGVITSGNAFPTTGESQGDFGLDSGLNIMDIGYNSSGSSITGYSYPTYLAQQYGMNSYTLSFYPLSNTFYANVSATTPIGEITFGVYNGNSNTLVPYTTDPLVGLPDTSGTFASVYTNNVIFDTGSNFNFLSTEALQTEIPNFSRSLDEGACANYGWPYNIVNGGFIMSYSLQNYGTSFTTEPSSIFCEAYTNFTLMEDNTFDTGSGFIIEDFGLPEMLRHTFTWVLATSGSNQGLVQYIGINP